MKKTPAVEIREISTAGFLSVMEPDRPEEDTDGKKMFLSIN
ncbi:MAG: hypothetical protein AB7S75_02365 [Desulfococcaceae bacterium]